MIARAKHIVLLGIGRTDAQVIKEWDVRFVVETLDGLSCQSLSLQYSDFNDSLSFYIA